MRGGVNVRIYIIHTSSMVRPASRTALPDWNSVRFICDICVKCLRAKILRIAANQMLTFYSNVCLIILLYIILDLFVQCLR